MKSGHLSRYDGHLAKLTRLGRTVQTLLKVRREAKRHLLDLCLSSGSSEHISYLSFKMLEEMFTVVCKIHLFFHLMKKCHKEIHMAFLDPFPHLNMAYSFLTLPC